MVPGNGQTVVVWGRHANRFVPSGFALSVESPSQARAGSLCLTGLDHSKAAAVISLLLASSEIELTGLFYGWRETGARYFRTTTLPR